MDQTVPGTMICINSPFGLICMLSGDAFVGWIASLRSQ